MHCDLCNQYEENLRPHEIINADGEKHFWLICFWCEMSLAFQDRGELDEG